jgi:hypothetical protein
MKEDVVVIEVENSRRTRRAPSRLSLLRKRVAGGRRAQREEFASVMEIARIIARKDPRALPALVKLIGRSSQSRVMNKVLRHDQDAEDCEYEERNALFDPFAPITPDGRGLEDLKRMVPAPRPLKLGVDLVFPWPWHQGRIINSLCELRPGGGGGEWRQDPNHAVILWLPLGYGDEVKREAVRLYLEGTNFRRIGRVLGVNHQSVINWVNARHASLPPARPPVTAPETLETDELFTFVGSKKRRRT